ncbi:MAG: hypothetical protein RSA60_06990 [Eubacterium sp.]
MKLKIINGYNEFYKFLESGCIYDCLPVPDNQDYINRINTIAADTDTNSLKMIPKSKDSAVLIYSSNRYDYLIGSYYAQMLSVPKIVISDFEKLLLFLKNNNYKSYSIFMPSDFFTLKNIYLINKASENKHIEIGYFPCADSSLLLFFVVKNLCYSFTNYEDKLSVLRLPKSRVPDYSTISKLTYYDKKSSTKDNLEEYFSDHFCKFASFLGHGRDDLFWLWNYNVICGNNECNFQDSQEGVCYPSCKYTGKCFEPGSSKLNAYDLKIENLFLYSCNSAKPHESLFAKNYSILYSFMSGYTRSIIGTQTIVADFEALNIYYIRLCESGFSLGYITNILNAFFINYRIGIDWNMLLIGDPNTHNEKNNGILALNYDFTSSECITINVNATGFFIIRIRLKNFDKNNFLDYLNLRLFIFIDCHGKSEHSFYKIFGCDELGWFIDVFSMADLEIANYNFKLVKTHVTTNTFHSIFNQLVDFQFPLNRINRKFGRDLIDLQNKKRKLQYLYRSTNSTYRYDEQIIYSKISSIQESENSLSVIFIEYLVQRAHEDGFRWEEYCYEKGYQIVSSDHEIFSICPSCKSEACETIFSHPQYSQYARIHHYCGNCGIVCDTPHEIDSKIEIEVEGINCKAGIENNIKIKLSVVGEKKEFCYLGYSVLWGGIYGFSYHNNIQKVAFDDKQIGVVHGSITIDSAVHPHTHPLKIYIILDGMLYSFRYNLWLNER